MPVGSRLTYGTLTLSSTEIISFTYDRSFNMVRQGTIALFEITQPGNLGAHEISVTTRIDDNASAKFTQWVNKLSEKPLEAFTFLNRAWGNYYLTDVSIESDEMDLQGDVIKMDMKLNFLSNQNFAP
jgi:hypothetical protein